MKFSIILPVYNCQKYLHEAIESVTKQTYTNWELVIIDDGSTDNTPQILDNISKKNKNIIVKHQDNKGQFVSRNIGVNIASGDYIMFLDADDLLHHNALMYVHNALKVDDFDIVTFNSTRDHNFINDKEVKFSIKPGEYKGCDYKIIKENICFGKSNALWNNAFKKTLFIDIAYKECFKYINFEEDVLQKLYLIDKAHSLVSIDKCLYFYRKNDNSTTASYSKTQLYSLVLVMKELKLFAKKWGGECITNSIIAEYMQYLYLLKISELSNASNKNKKNAFFEIRNTMIKENIFCNIKHIKIRLDNKLLLLCIERNLYYLAKLIFKFVEILKGLK